MILAALTAVMLAASTPASPDAACLECHGQADLKSDAGRSVFVDAGRMHGGAHGGLHCQSCHTAIREYPHPPHPAMPACATCHAAPAAEVGASAHGGARGPGCAGCHGPAHAPRRAAQMAPAECAACHARVVSDYLASRHGAERRSGISDSPACSGCHGPAHRIVVHTRPGSPVFKARLAATCGGCHADPDFLARHKIPFAHPVEAYRLSVHGRAVARGDTRAPSCSDCHTSHSIFPGGDPRSSLDHQNVPRTCGRCHAEVARAYEASVHGQAVRAGELAAPVCTDCHGEHTILAPSEPNSLVNPARVSTVTCGRCHSDRRLAQRYNMPTDRVATYQSSYHGLAERSGSLVVANCASCHGVHDILPSSDPRSTVNPANLARTCGKCHPGAGQRFAIGRVHVTPASTGENDVVRWIRLGYLALIPTTIGLMLLYVLLDFLAKLARSGPRIVTGEQYVRMNLNFRIAHWLVVVSFPTLIVSGFALKYPDSWWARPILSWEHSFPLRGTVHRVAAVILVSSILYHVLHLLASRRDRVILKQMLPRLRDASDGMAMIRHNLGLSGERPRFGMFSFAEKAEYLAFVWGSVVMLGSGLILWFNDWALRLLPKWVSDAATALHFYEAWLATLAILIWHLYMVVFDPDVYPMDKAWITGNASADHLRHARDRRYLRFLRPPKPRPKPEPRPKPRPRRR
ncbi:MAG TPA: cytochrome b/b6 domain-containing protein [Candidatus Saccharimonadales bacterium]|nr:cytochrome b/b6 domain-containing protein [Candidatus Saccharimonadales bacterium]